MAEHEQRPVTDLLAEAIEHLPPGDRQRVTAWCLSRLSSGGSHPQGWHVIRRDLDALVENLTPGQPDLPALFPRQGLGTGEHQMVPVRLPTELHSRLRTWSTEHGFSMATVVRGLITRFLDERAAEQNF
ncbi:MAG TPA: hypothetical protein VG756_21015 [Pseudonocardiaceae bacterium]|jgi:hypothetical protein|nr:hypothetical protein [Pseudonocardiaceae bacterium]